MSAMTMFERALPRDVAGPRATGWWGMLLVIITEAAFFTTLIASYFYLWSGADAWPPAGIKAPELIRPLFGTVLLLGVSVMMVLAERFVRAEDGRLALKFSLAAGALLALGFLSIQAYEYSISELVLDDNAYTSLFFIITGFHGLHVLVGLLMNLYLQLRVWKGHFSPRRYLAIQNVGLYWHFVDVVWLFVLLTVYITPHVLTR